jgi:Mg-chelatase subunit ChlD
MVWMAGDNDLESFGDKDLTEMKRVGSTDDVNLLVQFDSQDPQEVIIDAKRITEAQPLTDRTFQPRGGTPLLDATGTLIARASDRMAERAKKGTKPEHVLFVTITDGRIVMKLHIEPRA